MEKLFFVLALIFSALFVNAQDVIVSDSAYVSVKNDTFYQMRVQVYASGRKVTEEAPLGRDTVQAVSALLSQGYALSKEFANGLLIVENENRFRKTINGLSAAINAVTGLTYYRQIDARVGDNLLGEYRLKVGDNAPVNVSIIRTNAGLFRLRQGTTNYVVDVYAENLLRVRAYNNETFFLVQTGAEPIRFTGMGRKYILTKTQQQK